MDQYAGVLLSFPPDSSESPDFTTPHDIVAYDKAAKSHLNQLSNILKEKSADLITHGPQLLELLDPAVNSLSYLAVLHTLILPGLATSASREYLLEKLTIFLLSFDAIQARYGGFHLQDIFVAVGNGQLLPPSIAVETLTTAVLKLDPTGSLLTSTHIILTRLAYNTNNIEGVLPVVDKSIVFYPGMTNRGDAKFLCDATLPPSAYISRETGLTAILKPQNVMEHDLICGMIYSSRREWSKASAAFERIATFPAREHGLTKIMVDAYKRWVLARLLWKGSCEENLSPVSAAAHRYYEVLGKPYTTLVAFFPEGDALALKNEVEANAAVWQEDGTVGLVKEVLAAYQKWQVLALQQVYSKISLAELRRETRSAETGDHLSRDEDVEVLLRDMLISGMLSGVIEKNDDGTKYLTFLPPAAASLSERDLAKELAVTALRLRELRPLVRATDDRLGTHKEYIRYVVKESKRDKSSSSVDPSPGFGLLGGGGGGGIGHAFSVEVDDEDLMGGIISTS